MEISRFEDAVHHETATRRPRIVLSICALLLAAVPAARAEAVVSGETVLRALQGRLDFASPAQVVLFAPPEPRRLRPCCAFGGVMKVKLLGVPVPWYRHRPMRGAADIGPHEYDPGLLQILPSPVHDELSVAAGHRTEHPASTATAGEGKRADRPKREHNGELYTCRGGFLDTAHMRDFADLTWFLAARIEGRLDTGGSFDLRDYGGTRRITVHAVPRTLLDRAGRARVAVAVAGRLAFDLSVWREIATWYGYESVPPWPEKLSSFSPEDLYSNLLGTKLAEGILLTRPIRSRRDWDLAMSEWLVAAFDALGAVPADAASAVMDSVDDVLWNSSRWLPDWRITKRRKFDRGPSVEPWIARTGAAARACPGEDRPVVLPVAETLEGIAIDDVAEIDVVVSDRLLCHGFPLPRAHDRRVVESDYDGLIEAVRRETAAGLTDAHEEAMQARVR